MIKVTAETLRSYKEANYFLVDTVTEQDIKLRLSQPNAQAEEVLTRHNASNGFIFTAWNPHSVEQPLEQNQAMNDALLKDPLIDRDHVTVYPSYGSDDDQTWREQGFFFTNIDCLEAQELCLRYKQNAGVMISIGMGPELVWHPDVVLP